MRRLLASSLGVGVAFAPAAIAAGASDTDTKTGNQTLTDLGAELVAAPAATLNPLTRETIERHAARQLSEARERAERKAERRRAERRRARKRRAAKRSGGSATPTAPAAAPSPALQAIAACESGGDPGAIGGGGAYRGKYQFTYQTWASVGGSGDPAAASESEQDRRAAILYSRAGASPWPVCGR